MAMLLKHSTGPNLFDTHPAGASSIFQIDGNFGATAGIVVGGSACLAAIMADMLGAAAGGWGAVFLGQPAIWTVPLAFTVMIVVSLLTQSSLPANVNQVMLRMHLPEALSRQAYQRSPAPPAKRHP